MIGRLSIFATISKKTLRGYLSNISCIARYSDFRFTLQQCSLIQRPNICYKLVWLMFGWKRTNINIHISSDINFIHNVPMKVCQSLKTFRLCQACCSDYVSEISPVSRKYLISCSSVMFRILSRDVEIHLCSCQFIQGWLVESGDKVLLSAIRSVLHKLVHFHCNSLMQIQENFS